MNGPQPPYYLCKVDHLGNIVSLILNGENYGNWSRMMTNALKSKNKFCFVDEVLTKPENNNPKVHAWERCNSMVISWLYNVTDKALHGLVANVEKASETWTDLKERYS